MREIFSFLLKVLQSKCSGLGYGFEMNLNIGLKIRFHSEIFPDNIAEYILVTRENFIRMIIKRSV